MEEVQEHGRDRTTEASAELAAAIEKVRGLFAHIDELAERKHQLLQGAGVLHIVPNGKRR